MWRGGRRAGVAVRRAREESTVQYEEEYMYHTRRQTITTHQDILPDVVRERVP